MKPNDRVLRGFLIFRNPLSHLATERSNNAICKRSCCYRPSNFKA